MLQLLGGRWERNPAAEQRICGHRPAQIARGEKMFMQGAIPASKQGKAAIRRCAKTNGSTVYVIKRNIDVRIVPVGSFCP